MSFSRALLRSQPLYSRATPALWRSLSAPSVRSFADSNFLATGSLMDSQAIQRVRPTQEIELGTSDQLTEPKSNAGATVREVVTVPPGRLQMIVSRSVRRFGIPGTPSHNAT